MRHNDYPTTLLMEPAANDEPSYRMTPAASTMREWSAPLAPVMAYREACYEFEQAVHTYPNGTTEREAEAEIAASGAALIGFKREPEDEVWHTEAPTVPGVYVASNGRDASYRRHWDGKKWSCSWEEHYTEAEIAEEKAKTFADQSAIEWLRLIEADTPAPASQDSQHFVCIRAHNGTNDWRVGDIAVLPRGLDSANEPGNWRPCDADGWISHTPTADAVCPVPYGVKGEAMFRNGRLCADVHELSWAETGRGFTIVAWRPIQA